METKKLIDKLKKIDEELESLASDFISKFPQSSILYSFVEDLSSAHAGLESLIQNITQAVDTAQSEDALKADMLDQIQANPMYEGFDLDAQKRLAEYLVQQEAPVASDEDILQFIAKSFRNLPVSELVSNLSKEYVMALGEELAADIEPNEFDAYEAGVNEIKRLLGDEEERDAFIGLLSKEYFEQHTDTAIRKFYSKVQL